MAHLYARTKIFHHPSKLSALREGRLTPPLHVRLKPTNRCNHACTYCAYRVSGLPLSEAMNPRDELPPERLATLIEDFVSLGVRALTFSGGGEPLLHPGFSAAVRALGEGGVAVAALTNGSRLEGDAAAALAAHATWVRVSLDAGTPAGYAARRGVAPSEFGRVLDNLASFAAARAGGCVLGANLVVTTEGVDEIPAALRLLKEAGVGHVKIAEAVVHRESAPNRAYVRAWLPRARAHVSRARADLEDAGFTLVDLLPDPDAPGDAYARDYHRCPSTQVLTVVGADSQVYACQDKAYTRAGWLGSLSERRFADLWADPALAARLAAIDPARHCRHHCASEARNRLLLDYLDADPDHLAFV